jgi:phosphoserine phosphatase RsbU/P
MDRLREEGIAVPTVGLIGIGDRHLVAELQRRGCTEFLEKPFTPGEILLRVAKVLEQRRAARSRLERRCRLLEKDWLKIQQEVRKNKEDMLRLSKQLGSEVDAYRRLIVRTAGTEKLPLAWRNRPLVGLGGDYLGIQDTATGCDILLADVAGHDMGAFWQAVLIKTFFEENCHRGMDLPYFFRALNLHLLNRGGKERLVKAIFLRLDLEARQGYMISAAHPPLITDSRHCRAPWPLPAEGNVLGILEKVNFSTHRFPLLPGDRYFLFTDGVLDARRLPGQQEKLGISGVAELARETRGKPIKSAVRKMWKQILDHCGHRPHDDMVFLGLEIPAKKKGELSCST